MVNFNPRIYDNSKFIYMYLIIDFHAYITQNWQELAGEIEKFTVTMRDISIALSVAKIKYTADFNSVTDNRK